MWAERGPGGALLGGTILGAVEKMRRSVDVSVWSLVIISCRERGFAGGH